VVLPFRSSCARGAALRRSHGRTLAGGGGGGRPPGARPTGNVRRRLAVAQEQSESRSLFSSFSPRAKTHSTQRNKKHFTRPPHTPQLPPVPEPPARAAVAVERPAARLYQPPGGGAVPHGADKGESLSSLPLSRTFWWWWSSLGALVRRRGATMRRRAPALGAHHRSPPRSTSSPSTGAGAGARAASFVLRASVSLSLFPLLSSPSLSRKRPWSSSSQPPSIKRHQTTG
jgi:hypothetical protein